MVAQSDNKFHSIIFEFIISKTERKGIKEFLSWGYMHIQEGVWAFQGFLNHTLSCYFGRVVFMSHITQKNVKIKIVHWLSKYKAGSKSKITVAMLDLPECEGKFTISFTSNCIYKFAFKRSLHQPAYLW